MSNFEDIKKRLTMSTTLPANSAAGLQSVTNSAPQSHDDDDECEEDHTNPSGGCGCC